MAIEDVDGVMVATYCCTHRSSWSECWWAPAARSAFVMWTRWTLTVTVASWQPRKHSHWCCIVL